MRPLLALALAIAACGAPSGRERFAADVAPILERRCLGGACHGVVPGAEAAGDVIDRRFFYVDVDAAGRIVDLDAAYANVKARVNTVERPEYSSLLRKPLALAAGGLPHAGGHPFAAREHVDFTAILRWIAAERGGGEGEALASLPPLEQRFAGDVLPVLRDRGCLLSRCHGPLGFAGTVFPAPMDGTGGGFSTAEVRAGYEAARRNLALNGDPRRSRLLVKALPLDAGGVIHRGGNDTFFPRVNGRSPDDDPGARAIIDWAAAERAAAVGAEAPAEPAGIVFVRGPAEPRGLLDLESYHPGSDVWLHPSLEPGAAVINLTAALHPAGPADVRDPAVSHDGARLLFAMRTSEDDCHNIYELDLGGGAARRLTFDTGTTPDGRKPANRWPVYGPEGRIFFASTRAGEADETGRALDVELYELRAGEPVRLTYTPTPELAPTFLAVGEFRGSLAFTVIRRLGGRFEGPIFRFPPDHDRAAHAQPEYHPHHGQTVPADVTWTMRELPDGRDIAVLAGRDNVWGGGGLAIIERQLGPELTEQQLAGVSVPGFRHGVTILDAAGFWRDPAPLPDGRVVVSWAAGPIDPDDPAGGPPDTAIYLLELENGGGGWTPAGMQALVDAPGLADDQPAVVMVRPFEDEAHQDAWSQDGATGTLRHSGAATVEAVLRGLAPSGPKPLRADAAGLRLVEWIPTPTAPAVDPAAIANGDPASTWWSNGVHGPARVLADAPLAEDGTLFAALPARRPFRVQLLDVDGFAIGAQGARWLYLLGDEVHPQGVSPARYPRLCSGCHGSLDGDPASAMPPLTELEMDAVSGASVSLSTFEQANPRRPLAPLAIAGEPAAGFDFGRDLAPIFARSCAAAGCHAGAAPAAGLSLLAQPTAYYDSTYEALQAFGDGSTGGKQYVDERGSSAWGSYLMEKITGRELGAPRILDAACPAAPPVSAAEVRAIARWIDLGAIYRAPGGPP